MRVLFLCPNLQAGGAERHWSILLPELARRGVGVSVATLDGRGPFYEKLEAAGIPARCFAVGGVRDYESVAVALRRASPDVIVTRATSAHGLGVLATKGRRTSWVVNWHRPAGLPLPRRRSIALRAVLPAADSVIAVSQSQVEELDRFGVKQPSIRVIPNGTDFSPRSSDRERMRTALGIAEHEVVVLSAGRLDPQKRVDRFIDAVTKAQRTNESIVGLIAGSGSLAADLKSRAESAGTNVRFLGRREDMPGVLAAADMLCLTSDSEALPYVVLEAMASRLPVIATRTGALPEVITQETGVTIQLGDLEALSEAIEMLARDANLRRKMGASGMRRQQHLFSAGPMADAYLRTLSDIVGQD
jgi:glycosyltransferase involved in cell wall biosynthesis